MVLTDSIHSVVAKINVITPMSKSYNSHNLTCSTAFRYVLSSNELRKICMSLNFTFPQISELELVLLERVSLK